MNTNLILKILRPSFKSNSNRKCFTSLRNKQNEFGPSKAQEDLNEDIYEKMCRQEKEKIQQRDRESAEKMGAKSLPVKVLTYGALLMANYFIIRTAYDYVSNLNNTGDKTAHKLKD